MGSTLGGGIQITLEGGISARNLVARFVWLCFKMDSWWLKTKVENSSGLLRLSEGLRLVKTESISSLSALKIDCRT